MRAALAIVPLFALAAPAAAQPTMYRAVGTEPFWSLSIGPRQMRLDEPGRRAVTVATPVARPSFNGERYVTRVLTVDVTHAPCSDGMSDRVYRDTVTVQAGRRTLHGCGGGPGVTRSALADTRWTVASVNGRAIAVTRALTVGFTADRVEGRLCNSFGGGYRLIGDRLTVGPVMATRMACQGPAMLAEATLFRLWRQPAVATVSRWGTLTIASGRDTVTLRPAPR